MEVMFTGLHSSPVMSYSNKCITLSYKHHHNTILIYSQAVWRLRSVTKSRVVVLVLLSDKHWESQEEREDNESVAELLVDILYTNGVDCDLTNLSSISCAPVQ